MNDEQPEHFDNDPVGILEVRRRREVTRETARQWGLKGWLPEPDYPSVHDRPAWEWVRVDAYLDDRTAEMPVVRLANPIGTHEICGLLGVSLNTVRFWKNGNCILPEPTYDSINGVPAWELTQIVYWAHSTGRGGRLPGEFQLTALPR